MLPAFVLLLALWPVAAQERPPGPPDGLVEASAPFQTEEGVTVEGRLTWRADLAPGVRTLGVLLLHGSNDGLRLRKDVDGTIPPAQTSDGREAKRFRDLARALAREGFLVYRTAKRGYALDPTQDRLDVVATITLERTLSDGRRALARLRADPRIDPRRVLLLGHSEGTVVAPLLARDDEGIAGLILTGTVVDMDRVARYQAVDHPVEEAFAALDEDHDGRVDMSEAIHARERGLELPACTSGRWDRDGDGAVSRAEAQRALLPGYRAFVRQAEDPADYWHGHLRAPRNLELLPTLRRLPLIVVTGELDWRTPCAQARELQRALARAGHPDHLFVYCPGLGHGFSPPRPAGSGDLAPQETAGPPDPSVVRGIARLAAQRWLDGAGSHVETR